MVQNIKPSPKPEENHGTSSVSDLFMLLFGKMRWFSLFLGTSHSLSNADVLTGACRSSTTKDLGSLGVMFNFTLWDCRTVFEIPSEFFVFETISV